MIRCKSSVHKYGYGIKALLTFKRKYYFCVILDFVSQSMYDFDLKIICEAAALISMLFNRVYCTHRGASKILKDIRLK